MINQMENSEWINNQSLPEVSTGRILQPHSDRKGIAMQQTVPTPMSGKKRWARYLCFACACLLLNLVLSRLAGTLKLPLYLDSAGTILAGAIGGYVPGILVGYATNLINGIGDDISIYYAVLSTLIAVLAAFLHSKGWFKSPLKTLATVPMFAFIGGALGSLLTWLLYGLDFSKGASASLVQTIYTRWIHAPLAAQMAGDFIVDLADKAIMVAIVWTVLMLIPDELRRSLYFRLWKQEPLTRQDRSEARRFKPRKASLRSKMVTIVILSMLIIAVVTTGICFSMFHNSLISAQCSMGYGVNNVIIGAMDPERVEEYIRDGENAPGYRESEAAMAEILTSSEDIKYIYVYQIREDGCHVVFDLDVPGEPGGNPGDIIPFDDAFRKQLPKLLAGEKIEPVISDESFGWLLSVYTPVRNSKEETVCYAAVDISMEALARDEYAFLAKVLALFISFAVLIIAVILWMVQYGVILPINSMSMASGRFAFDSEQQMGRNLEQLQGLKIRTGDEIENLYLAITKTTEESVRYIEEAQQKNETIARMQENLITVLADMVESRDQYTGNHIKNTSEYVRIIMEQLRKEGIYTDQLTDEFMQNVIHSAPLHDIGKIRISDTILNKPGKLTDEEFELMKKHTIYGREVIGQARRASSDASYLDEAENLATYHHEKWNGKGYPYGLAGEEIPLSARIMAVADVFDALVSKRSYKDGFSVEKSLDIIREGIGTHFDPKVAEAFLHAEDEVRLVVQEQQNA